MSNNDVPSPIDLRNRKDAIDWEHAVNIKRPWRYDFFNYYVTHIQAHFPDDCKVLELGSGPGFLAQHLLERLPDIEYTAFDFSKIMHELAKSKLKASSLEQVTYIVGDFKEKDWNKALNQYDCIIIHQALHELRHKKYAADFHNDIIKLMKPDASYLVCDHLFAPDAISNSELYMSRAEHLSALKNFNNVHIPLEIKGLCLFECRM